MESKKIKQVIIVEGKHDIDFLSTFLNADFIKTDGTSLPQETIELIKEMDKQGREFIILTDPDSPGESIRKKLQEIIPSAKHAFVNVKEAKAKNKVGVEHSNQEEIIKALDKLMEFEVSKETITNKELFELGLIGLNKSSQKRIVLETGLRMGHGTSKTFLKRLNYLGLSKKDLINKMKELNIWDK